MELFPNLPEEIGRECLLRVSYQFHSKLRDVCKSWEAVVDKPSFYEDRKRCGTSEQCICLVQAVTPPSADSIDDKKSHRVPIYALTLYDPLQGIWKRHFPPLAELADGIPLFSECFSLHNKLVLIGGWHPSRWEALRSVFVYDFSSGLWRRGADMPARVRSFFACSVDHSHGLIYVAGGHDDCKNALRGAAVYSVEEDKWEILCDMREERDESRGAFLEGKFYVISGYETQSQGRFKQSTEVFDPNTGLWTTLECMWTAGACPRTCMAAFGHLYSFQKNGVMCYDTIKNVWNRVESLPQGLQCVRCSTVWRDSVFVSGHREGSGDQICYLFRPPNSKKESTTSVTWVAIDGRPEFVGIVQSAATIEI